MSAEYEDFSDASIDDDDITVEDVDDPEELVEDVEPAQYLEEEEGDEEEDEENLDDDDLDIEEDENVINVSENHKFEIVSKDKTYERIHSRKKETQPFMSRFEFTKLVGIRAQQLSCGMQPCVSFDPEITNTEFIAVQELLQRKMPLIVRRYLPNGLYEDWRVDELMIPDTIMY